MKTGKKIGIMGGTFNPVHYGHLLIAEEARIFCDLDEIIFIPSGSSYMKDADEIISGRMRIAMTALAIEENPHFSLSDMEIKRIGNTYTYETIEELKTLYPDAAFFFILGADNLFSVEKWKYADKILKNCTLIAAARGKKSEEELNAKADYLRKKYQSEILILPEKKVDISSTEIRERIQKGMSVRHMTPDKVLSYISEHQLYQ